MTDQESSGPAESDDLEAFYEVDEFDPSDAAADLPSRKFESWRRRTAVGGIATGIAMGLQEIFQPNRNEPVLVSEAPGDPPDSDRGFRVVLDPDDPTKSRVIMTAPAEPTEPSDQPE